MSTTGQQLMYREQPIRAVGIWPHASGHATTTVIVLLLVVGA